LFIFSAESGYFFWLVIRRRTAFSSVLPQPVSCSGCGEPEKKY
jgi:hypothetical protein